MSESKLVKYVFFISLIFFYVFSVIGLSRTISNSDSTEILPYRAAEPHWPMSVLKSISLGHWPVLADYYWIQVLIDPSLDPVQPGERSAMFYDLDRASEMDPLFFDLHYYGSSLLTIARKDHEGAKIILERSRETYLKIKDDASLVTLRTAYWHSPFSIWIGLGYLYIYQLDNFIEAQKVFREASTFPSAPAYLGRLADKLSDPGQAIEIGIRITKDFIQNAKTDTTRRAYEERLKSFQVTQWMWNLNQKFLEYQKQKKPAKIADFLQKQGLTEADPFGGKLYIDESGKISTTTKHPRVFGF